MEIISNYGFVFMALAVIFGLYMCWGIGANDVANAMGTSAPLYILRRHRCGNCVRAALATAARQE